MTITIEDILPMDKGTSAATEFTYDERYVDYLMNKPERLDWKHGLIHSHNNMGVFFSGTDEKELATNAKAHNYYLSVVVNNRLDIIGKIGFIGELEAPVKAPYYALDENGNKYLVEKASFVHKKEKLFTYNCNISYNLPENNMDKEFMENVSRILEPKGKPFVDNQDWIFRNSSRYMGTDYNYEEQFKTPSPVNNQRINSYKKPTVVAIDDNKIESFILTCLGYHKSYLKHLDFEDCLEDMQISIDKEEIDDNFLVDMFFENYLEFYDEFFNPEFDGGVAILEKILTKLKSKTDKYTFLTNLINQITYELK